MLTIRFYKFFTFSLQNPLRNDFQCDTHRQSLIDRCHKAIRQTADVFFQPQLVDGSDLLCKGGRIVFEQFRYSYLYMSGKPFPAHSTACDGDNHYHRTVLISNVIRYDQNRTCACLFLTDDWIEFRIVEVAASYLFVHLLLPPFLL